MADGSTPRPPIAGEPLGVLLLTRDADAALPAVDAWDAHLAGLGRPCELIIVSDTPGTTDLAARSPRIRVAHPESPRGIGACLRIGLELATTPLLAVVTLDEPVPSAELAALLARIDEVDAVVGHRAGQPMPAGWRATELVYRVAMRVLLGFKTTPPTGWLGTRAHAYAWAVRQVFGVRIEDLASPLMLFRRSILERVPVQSDGPFAFAEVLAKVNFLGALMDEVPLGRSSASFPAVAWPWPAASAVRSDAWKVFRKPEFRRV